MAESPRGGNKLIGSLRERGVLGTFRIGVRWMWIPLSRPFRRWLKDRARRRTRERVPGVPSLRAWLKAYEPLRPESAPPTPITVVVPVYRPDPAMLQSCIDSVRAQTHAAWTLVLVDDASPDGIGEVLDRIADEDDRVTVVHNSENLGIAGATNAGIASATGDYVVFLDQDDELGPTALEWCASCTPEADLVYTDEYKIDARGRVSSPLFKPAWSPVLLTSVNYINHLTCIRRSLLEQVGRLRTGYDGAQDHDLLLRIAERSPRVAHIPHLLYRWRAWGGSVAGTASSKVEAERAGLRALGDAIERRGWNAEPGVGAGSPFNYRVRWKAESPPPTVKAIIPTRDRLDLLATAVAGALERTDDVDLHLVIVDNGSREDATLDYLSLIATRDDVTVIRHDDAFNFSQLVNLGAAAGPKTEYLLLLNNDIHIEHRGWLRQMLGWFAEDDVVGVGTKLRFPDGRIQHAGVVVGMGGVAGHYSLGTHERPVLGNFHDQAREVGAATAAAFAVRTSSFEAVDGFNEDLPIDYQDVDFCLKLRHQLGGRIVYDPTFPLAHEQGASRGTKGASNPYTLSRMRFLWGREIDAGDPYYNPHLNLRDHRLVPGPVPRTVPERREKVTPRWSGPVAT